MTMRFAAINIQENAFTKVQSVSGLCLIYSYVFSQQHNVAKKSVHGLFFQMIIET